MVPSIEEEVEKMKGMKFIVVGLLIFLCGGVLAVSGVNPRSHEIDFESDSQVAVSFNFFLGDGVSGDLRVEGDLAWYVSLDKEKISGQENVVASLLFPFELDSPGVNELRIIAGDVVGIIKVRVPYPDEYVELELDVPNINVWEDVELVLNIVNRGNDSALVNPLIEIYLGDELIDSFYGGDIEIAFGDSGVFETVLNTSSYFSGDYSVVATVEHGGRTVKVDNPFSIGELSVEILDYTERFRENKLDRFEIDIISLWDDDISEVYAEITVLDSDITFSTSIGDLKAWGTTRLVGFIDTGKISDEEFEARISVYYNGEVTSKMVSLKIEKGFDWVLFGSIILSLVIIGFIIWRGRRFIEKLKQR